MRKILQAESTLTDRYQTTIPETIREVLHLHKRDKISYVIADNGEVLITKADNEDPVLGHFLSFLASDIKTNPSHIHGN
jgi:antitoxin PrlF